MSLKGRLSQEFAGKIRDRGFAYFRTGAVELFEPSQSQVDARVKGGEVYLVRLKLGRASLGVACTCAYFEKGEKCKHIWATMLAADSGQYLKDADLVTPLNLILDYVSVAELRKVAHRQHSLANNGDDDRFRSPTPTQTNLQGELTTASGWASLAATAFADYKHRTRYSFNGTRRLVVRSRTLIPHRPGLLAEQRQTLDRGWLPRTHHERRMGQDEIETDSDECTRHTQRSRGPTNTRDAFGRQRRLLARL